MSPRPAVFFDRDGTLMEEVEYCADPRQVRLYAGVPLALRELKAAGFLAFVVTNQSGIGRGFFTEAQYQAVQAQLLAEIGPGLIDASYFCPDAPGVPSSCRKPETGMLRQAARDFPIDLPRSYFIGDKSADIECGRRAGTRTILVMTGYGPQQTCSPDWRASDVTQAIHLALDQTHDESNGYEAIAERFMSARNPRMGVATVREWSEALPHGSSILDLGCGHGVPISQTLIDNGFAVHGIDASAKMIAAFRERFPDARAECSSVEDSAFFGRTFDGVVAWGLMFLLPADVQAMVVGKVAKALNCDGKFLFTAPQEAVTWLDVLTGRESISLGRQAYQEILSAEGLTLDGEQTDEGDNHYYFASKSDRVRL